MALVNGGLLALYGHEEVLKKSSSLKALVQFNFEIISQEFSLGDPFQKFSCKFDP